MKIVNRPTLADWLYKQLGAPAVKPPITPSQMDNCIDEAMDYFTYHAGGTGHEEQYVVIQTKRISESNDLQTSPYMDLCFLPDMSAAPYLRYKHEYQLPRNVVAIGNTMPQQCNSAEQTTEPILERGFALTSQGILSTGIGGIQGAGFGSAGTALWVSNFGGMYSNFGGRGGGGLQSAGGGADLIGYELGLEYLEMLRQRYTIKMDAQYMEESNKVRFSPRPAGAGAIILSVWSRVDDPALYDNIWIRRYALSLSKINMAYNVKKYSGAAFSGGANVDGDFYLAEGKEERERLEQEIRDNTYNYPPRSFYQG